MRHLSSDRSRRESSGSAKLLPLVLAAGLVAVSASAILIRWCRAPSLSIAFWRVVMALCLLAPCWLKRGWVDELRGLSAKDRRALMGAGVCLGVHFWSWIASLSYTSVAVSVLLVTTNPIWVGLLSPILTGERLSRGRWVWVGVALSGATVVGLSADAGTVAMPQPVLGAGLALVGALAASVYWMLGRRVRPRLGIWSYTSATLLGALPVLGLGLVWVGGPWVGFGWEDWALFAIMAALPQLVGHGSMNWALRHVSANVIAVVLLLEPVGASLLAALLLGEVPGMMIGAGGALVIVGVVGVTTRSGEG